MKVPLASSGLRDSDLKEAVRVLESGNLTMGVEVKKFVALMANYLGVKHFVMTNSGSSANLLMIEALMRPTLKRPSLNPGDTILVPAIAWPTTVWPLIQLGLNPLFVDVDKDSLAIDLNLAQQTIESSRINVRGIFPIHPLGYAIDSIALEGFAEQNELVLINDVCESLGSWRGDIHAGICGVASSFSFYFSHHITTIEGGGIATNDDLVANDLLSMRSHGWSRDRRDIKNWNHELSTNDSKFLFVSTGYNLRPMEIQAAIGSNQIPFIDEFVERRRRIARKVSQSLENSKLKVIGSETLGNSILEESHSWMLIPIVVTGQDAATVKREIVHRLEGMGIETRPVLTGNFLSQPAIKRITGNTIQADTFKVATEITERAFLVGAHHDLSDEQIDFLCFSLTKVSGRN